MLGPKKLALTVIMRKLIVLLNHLLKNPQFKLVCKTIADPLIGPRTLTHSTEPLGSRPSRPDVFLGLHVMHHKSYSNKKRLIPIFVFAITIITPPFAYGAAALKVAGFSVDATPPAGSRLTYDTMDRVVDPLWLKGLVFLTEDKPVVIVAVDWIGIASEGHLRFREKIANAVGTTVDRVALHCLHQHDAPYLALNWSAAEIAARYGLTGDAPSNLPFVEALMTQAGAAAQQAAAQAEEVTHIGLGQAKVAKVASNRRILGPDGKVLHTRWSTTKEPEIRAFPEGLIDPYLKSISFYHGDKLLSVLTYYATHPQSYYRTGAAESDFPGIARILREDELGVPHVHFNGAGGNITAGKYNDGDHDNRVRFAGRLAKGMAEAFASSERIPVDENTFGWEVASVSLPLQNDAEESRMLELLGDESAKKEDRMSAAWKLASLRWHQAGHTFDLACLRLGKARVLHMPGELFVEYQLNAARLRPDLFVAMAAYGDSSPGYIGTAESYAQGGYETQKSHVTPQAEQVLMDAVKLLLKVDK